MIKFESLKSDILDRLPAATAVLQSRREVVFAYLFGGLANGYLRPLSDVDIAVYLGEDMGPDTKLPLFNELSDALRTSELDLVVLNTAPISLTGRILSNKKNLVDKNPFLRHRYESLTRRKYFDFQWIENDFFDRKFGKG